MGIKLSRLSKYSNLNTFTKGLLTLKNKFQRNYKIVKHVKYNNMDMK